MRIWPGGYLEPALGTLFTPLVCASTLLWHIVRVRFMDVLNCRLGHRGHDGVKYPAYTFCARQA